MTHVRLLRQFALRYRAALAVRAGVIAALGMGCCALLAWRLRAWTADARLWIGMPALLAAGLLGGVVWWLRRRWMGRAATAAFLDRAMKLEQRLVTAEEFSEAAQAAPLYQTLVDDLSHRLKTDAVQVPRPWDHKAGVLLAALLLLLLWPRFSRMLVQQQHTADPSTPLGAGSTRQPAQEEQRQAGDQQQQAAQGQQEQHTAGSTQHTAQDQQQQQSAAGSQQSAQSQQEQHTAGSTQQSAQSQQQQQSAAGSQRSAKSRQQAGQQQAAQGQQRGQGQRLESPSARDGSGSQGTGQSFGEGAALKAEIQQLLKEVSGELKNLQAQLEAANAQPEAGTTTDPNLYGDASALEDMTAQSPIPLELKTDTGATQKPRAGGGVGKPTGEISPDGPRTKAEEAHLSEQPLEETAASRQPVPAEYRSVFDRLQRQRGPAH